MLESNPFETNQVLATPRWTVAPIAGRVHMMWESIRGEVVGIFPKAPGLTKDKWAYLRHVDEIYRNDAYHSLSIEGYSVTPEIMDRVYQGNRNPDNDEVGRKSRDALAARVYWHGFQVVNDALGKVIVGENPAALARAAHQGWYRELFASSVKQPFPRIWDCEFSWL